MGRIGVVAGALLVVAGPVRAGLYNPIRPTSPLVTGNTVQSQPYEQLRAEVNALIVLGDPLRRKERQPLLDRRLQLLARGPSALSATEAAELGAIQWRLREGEAAVTVLKRAAADRTNFWVAANLGTILQAQGQLREAQDYLQSARDLFPDPWPAGATTGDWFKVAEKYQLTLLRLRMREGFGRPPGARPVPAADVDALFPVKFVGPSGKYAAGRIADAEKAKLPADAVAVVQQLLLWFPEDTRLLWLLAELYNAQGDVEAASKLLDDCVWQRRYESPVLREHRRIVQEAYEAQAKAAPVIEEPPPAPAPQRVILPSGWQLYAVGLGFGAVVLVLGYWQISELVRRLRRPARGSE
jgi:tetratricopeptide (TPR) repeat protein